MGSPPGLGYGIPLEPLARLAADVSAERAIAETTRIFAQTRPATRVRLVPRTSDETGGLASPLLLLLGATGLLLMIACANVAALSLGELVVRRRELATRIALGARTGRIVRQLLTETLVIGMIGSGIGIALAFAGTSLMVALGPPLPRVDAIRVDFRVLAFAVTMGVSAVLLSGTLPALVSARRSRDRTSLDPTRGASRHRGRLERAVVALEVAMTVMLLVAGGLLGRSLSRLFAVEPGFDPSNVATVRVALPPPLAGASDAPETIEERLEQFRQHSDRVHDEILPRLMQLPGVVTAAATTRLLFPGELNGTSVRIVGREGPAGLFNVRTEDVTPGYHETLRIPIRAERSARLRGRARDAGARRPGREPGARETGGGRGSNCGVEAGVALIGRSHWSDIDLVVLSPRFDEPFALADVEASSITVRR